MPNGLRGTKHAVPNWSLFEDTRTSAAAQRAEILCDALARRGHGDRDHRHAGRGQEQPGRATGAAMLAESDLSVAVLAVDPPATSPAGPARRLTAPASRPARSGRSSAASPTPNWRAGADDVPGHAVAESDCSTW